MQKTLRVLNVFLASPEDVKPERLAAEKIVNDINKSLERTLGWHIALHGWEDVTPGYGRPQEIINASVDDCALFIGLLWERWGQQTGKYSSGFEEEYERALARRKITVEPQIWLVFKAISSEKLKDPGAQLSKVLEFRRTQGALREVLYKEVTDPDDWKAKLQNWLWAHVAEMAILVSHETQPQTPTSSLERYSSDAASATQTAGTLTAATLTVGNKIPNQLTQVASSLTQVIKSGKMEFSREDTDRLQEFDIARLFLLSATWMFRRYTGDTIGTHEINLLYKYRERLDVTPTEYLQLFRAVVSDNDAVVPGWFWFSEMTQEAVGDWLLSLASHDSAINVRRCALRLLRTARIKLPKESWPALYLFDSDDLLQAEAYEYLAFAGDDSALSSLADAASGESAVSSAAREARLSLLLRLRPLEAFSEIIESGQYAFDERIRQLAEFIADVGDDILLKAAANQWEQIRKLALVELARRGRLSADLAMKLTEDVSITIREIAFTELAKQDPQLDLKKVRQSLSKEEDLSKMNWARSIVGGKTEATADAGAVIRTFYRNRSAETALKAVDWFLIDGVPAYKSLAIDHYDAVHNDLRPDLENGFSRVRQQSIEAMERSFGIEETRGIIEKFGTVEEFVRSEFAEAALSGLVAHGQPGDIRFGRQYLSSDNPDTKLAAVRIVCRFGTADDVAALLEISREAWGELRDEAGACALRLSSDPFKVALELTQNQSSKLVLAGFGWLYERKSPEVENFFKELLKDEDAADRLRSVYFFSRKLDQAELEQLLITQFEEDTYYYDVVTWLDRLLYSPAPVREFFARELERLATS